MLNKPIVQSKFHGAFNVACLASPHTDLLSRLCKKANIHFHLIEPQEITASKFKALIIPENITEKRLF